MPEGRPDSELRLICAPVDGHHFDILQESPYVEIVEHFEVAGEHPHSVQFRITAGGPDA